MKVLKSRKITLDEWDVRYAELKNDGLEEPDYGGSLRRHFEEGDTRLAKLEFDDSAASLRLWNFLLSEEERLKKAKQDGKCVVGTMKDLGTVPVMAYSFPDMIAFYPDGAWWIPCVMEMNAGLLDIADSLGLDESFCPVRAMLGAFLTEAHFPTPDLLICSVGAVCDDFSAVAQRLNGLGYPVLWWEMPHRRPAADREDAVELPGGFSTSNTLVEFVRMELERIKTTLERQCGRTLDERELRAGINKSNQIRHVLRELRLLVYSSARCPLPALEMLIAEIMAIHYCSDQDECLVVLNMLLDVVRERVDTGIDVLGNDQESDSYRIYWVNPVADLRVMNMLEDYGGRLCGADFMFSHALNAIPDDLPPLEALARMALADPMVGSARDRANAICDEIRKFRAEAVIVSKIPGASHCAFEGTVIHDIIQNQLSIPVLEIEVPPISDSFQANIGNRFQALMEICARQKQNGDR